jgi:hypothetical protein
MLTVTQQLQIIGGSPNPPETDLLSLLLQTGVNTAMTFIDNEKTIIENDPAQSYQDKLRGVSFRMLTGDENLLFQLRRIFVAILGRTNVTWAQVGNATQAQWETFATDECLNAFEYIARTTLEEKFEYDNLPA